MCSVVESQSGITKRSVISPKVTPSLHACSSPFRFHSLPRQTHIFKHALWHRGNAPAGQIELSTLPLAGSRARKGTAGPVREGAPSVNDFPRRGLACKRLGEESEEYGSCCVKENIG